MKIRILRDVTVFDKEFKRGQEVDISEYYSEAVIASGRGVSLEVEAKTEEKPKKIVKSKK